MYIYEKFRIYSRKLRVNFSRKLRVNSRKFRVKLAKVTRLFANVSRLFAKNIKKNLYENEPNKLS